MKKILLLIILFIMLMPFSVRAEYLYDFIKKDSIIDNKPSDFVINNNGIDFNMESSDTNGKGVYEYSKSLNKEYPIYYYRGDVSNNNIILGNVCWQIVRTTDTGGIKIIYNGVANDNKCPDIENDSVSANSFYNDGMNFHMGYMYGNENGTTYDTTHTNETDSEVKKVVDNWYEDNIKNKSYEKYLEDTVWCNDRSLSPNNTGTGAGNSFTIYAWDPNIPISDKLNLYCPNKNDSFTVSESIGNGKLKYPVGLITASEAVLTGYSSGEQNSKKFLNALNTFTMTPSYVNNGINVIMRIYDDLGVAYSGYYVDTWASNFKPMISLKNDVEILSGDGSKDNPLIIGYKYNINVLNDNDKGSITFNIDNLDNVIPGTKVQFSIDTNNDYEVEDCILSDLDGHSIPLINTDNNSYEFIMPEKKLSLKLNYNKKDKFINVLNNPNTSKGTFIILVFIIMIISFVLYIVLSKLQKNKLF